MSIRDDYELISLQGKPQKDDEAYDNDSVIARGSAFLSAHKEKSADPEKGDEEFEREDGSLKRESLFHRSIKNSPRVGKTKQENLPVAEGLKSSSLTLTESMKSQ